MSETYGRVPIPMPRSEAPMPGAPPVVPVVPVAAVADPVLSDQALLAACAVGDAQAWRSLLARYERLVFATALRQGLNRDDAADVTQTVFIALLDSISQLRQQDRLPFWLMTVARRQAWRIARHASLEQPSPHVAVLASEPGLDWEDVALLHEALNQLQPPCRDLLLALYFDPSEPSYADVARRQGRAVGGIGPMRGRCLESLRTLLADMGER